MNRTIKFRIWDRDNLIFDYVDFSHLRHLIDVMDDINTYYKDYFADPEQPNLLMQFTGLKDKNGKEIYEGDIVKYYQPYSKKWDIHIVKWDSLFASFGLYEQNEKWCKESDWIKIEEIEEIGNIHQNSDLLSKDKQ